MSRRSRRSWAVVALVVLVIATSACAADWTQRLGDDAHTTFTPDNGLTASNVGSLREKWRLAPPPCNGVTTGANWFATPVVYKGVIYIGSDYGCLHAIDKETGRIIWTRF